MRYGTIPVAYSTGGLVDTIVAADGADKTGFLFDDHTPASFAEEVRKALLIFRRKETWHKLITNAMEKDFSWERSAVMYLELYGKPLN